MHIVGVPVATNCTRGMKKQVGKSKLFTKTSLTAIQDKMRNACIKSYNKFYEINTRLKEKQKEQKLAKANNQTKQLDDTSKDINEILSNLKPTKQK